jgi:hypothetical protein
MNVETMSIRGSFGDGRVLLHLVGVDHPGPLVLLFHGVHGCADMTEGNKYGSIARLLLKQRIASCLVETSRLRRDRETFGEDRNSWAKEAFRGKSFSQDLWDLFAAFCYVRTRLPERPLWLWGFSLGGIESLFLLGSTPPHIPGCGELPKPDVSCTPCLFLSGSGDTLRPEAQESRKLPILDSLLPQENLHEAARRTRVQHLTAFYGSEDTTFSEESCRRLANLVHCEDGNRRFLVLDGCDHSFRTLRGIPSQEPIRNMCTVITVLRDALFPELRLLPQT